MTHQYSQGIRLDVDSGFNPDLFYIYLTYLEQALVLLNPHQGLLSFSSLSGQLSVLLVQHASESSTGKGQVFLNEYY